MPPLQDQQVESFIGLLLRTGVLLSAAVTLLGFAVFLLHHGAAFPRYHAFLAALGKFPALSALAHQAGSGHASAILQIGILLLIATPVARVAFLCGAFALQRDRLYVGVSGLVLLVLLFSLFLAK